MRHALLAALLPALLLSACTQPDASTAGDDYVSECPAAGCPDGTRCTDDGRCELLTDEDCVDGDEDGFGRDCALGADCNDDDYFTNPAVDEICDGADNNCDGRVDEDGVCDTCEPQCEVGARECQGDLAWRACAAPNGCPRWLPLSYCEQQCVDGACTTPCDDFDGDGYGEGCTLGADCDDRNPFAFPTNREVCDGYDNDCHGGIDDGGVCDIMCPPAPCRQGERRCEADGRYAICTGDDDGCLAWSAPLACRGDLTCDGGQCVVADTCTDLDNDGFGFGGACAGLDCDDDDPTTHPAATERCDARDNDCDGAIDDGLASCAASLCQPANDTRATAIPLASGASLASATCGANERFFRLTGAPTAVLALASRDGDAAPLTLTLYRGQTALASNTAPMAGLATDVPAAAGDLFLGVRDSRQASAPFLLTWLDPHTPGCDDAFEPDNSPATAAPAPPDRHLPAGACANDLDFYEVAADLTRTVVATRMVFLPGTNEPSLELWRDGAAVTIDQRIAPGVRVASLRLDAHASTQAHVRHGAGARYLLGVHAYPAPACTDDARDQGTTPDDTIPHAAPLTIGRPLQGTLCAADVDIFDLGQIARGGNVDVTIDFDANALNLDAYLFYDNLDGFAQRAATDAAPERLPTGISQPGHYYVMVLGHGATDQGPYTITAR